MAARKRSRKTLRTRKGNVTATARKKFGMKGKAKGKFPVFDRTSALQAIRFRSRGKGIKASTVLSKVSRWATAHNDATVKAAVKRARAVDK